MCPAYGGGIRRGRSGGVGLGAAAFRQVELKVTALAPSVYEDKIVRVRAGPKRHRRLRGEARGVIGAHDLGAVIASLLPDIEDRVEVALRRRRAEPHLGWHRHKED